MHQIKNLSFVQRESGIGTTGTVHGYSKTMLIANRLAGHFIERVSFHITIIIIIIISTIANHIKLLIQCTQIRTQNN